MDTEFLLELMKSSGRRYGDGCRNCVYVMLLNSTPKVVKMANFMYITFFFLFFFLVVLGV
jgi:hypothetical protein